MGIGISPFQDSLPMTVSTQQQQQQHSPYSLATIAMGTWYWLPDLTDWVQTPALAGTKCVNSAS
jgi:hypothetical protein